MSPTCSLRRRPAAQVGQGLLLRREPLAASFRERMEEFRDVESRLTYVFEAA